MPKYRHETRQLMSNLLINCDLLSEKGKQNRDGGECYENKKSVSIKFRTIRSTNSLIVRKSIETNSRKSYRYSRVTARRFTSAHVASVGNLQSSDLAGMNISTVISTGSLSRPSVDFLTANSDIHGEFGTDLLNLVPTDRDLAKWISDSDSFIEDSHLRANKGEVKEIADQQRPTKSCVKAFDTLNKETLRGDTGTEKIDKSGKKVTTSRAVDLRISHTNSLSRKVVR